MKVALYACVSTLDQNPENQLQELRRYCEARGWNAAEYVDQGVSGSKELQPAVSWTPAQLGDHRRTRCRDHIIHIRRKYRERLIELVRTGRSPESLANEASSFVRTVSSAYLQYSSASFGMSRHAAPLRFFPRGEPPL